MADARQNHLLRGCSYNIYIYISHENPYIHICNIYIHIYIYIYIYMYICIYAFKICSGGGAGAGAGGGGCFQVSCVASCSQFKYMARL